MDVHWDSCAIFSGRLTEEAALQLLSEASAVMRKEPNLLELVGPTVGTHLLRGFVMWLHVVIPQTNRHFTLYTRSTSTFVSVW